MNIQLRKFNPAKMGDDRICVFIGKRNTGKSTLVKDIMYYKKHIPAGIVLSAQKRGTIFTESSYQTSVSTEITTGKPSIVFCPGKENSSVRGVKTTQMEPSCFWMIVCMTQSF